MFFYPYTFPLSAGVGNFTPPVERLAHPLEICLSLNLNTLNQSSVLEESDNCGNLLSAQFRTFGNILGNVTDAIQNLRLHIVEDSGLDTLVRLLRGSRLAVSTALLFEQFNFMLQKSLLLFGQFKLFDNLSKHFLLSHLLSHTYHHIFLAMRLRPF